MKILEAMKEMGNHDDFKVLTCNGAAECKKALLLLNADRLPENFLEGMICTGGCVNGPGVVKPLAQSNADRNKALATVDARTIEGSIASQGDLEFSMHRSK